MPAPLRDVPQEAIELIKAFEGIPDGDPSTVMIDAYLCPADVWTIGWGHAIVDGGAQLKGAAHKARARALYPGGITRAQAEALLAADLIPRAASVSSLLKLPVDDGAFGALIALVFNIGAGNLAASTLLRKLNAGDRAGAAEQFLAWDKARINGVLQPLAGLTRRRRAERALFLGEDWRAAAATRSRGAARPLGVLPVPVPPADQAPARRAAPRKAASAAKEAAPTRKSVPVKKSAPGGKAAAARRPAAASKKAVAAAPAGLSRKKAPTPARPAAGKSRRG
jgi:lysozyme